MTHATCRLTAKNRNQLRNPTVGNRVWATFTFFYWAAQKKQRNEATAIHTASNAVHINLAPFQTGTNATHGQAVYIG